MVILFIGKPTVSLQVELKQLLASSPPCFFILVWLMNSERSVMVTTEHPAASSRTSGSNSAHDFQATWCMVASLEWVPEGYEKLNRPTTHISHAVHAHTCA